MHRLCCACLPNRRVGQAGSDPHEAHFHPNAEGHGLNNGPHAAAAAGMLLASQQAQAANGRAQQYQAQTPRRETDHAADDSDRMQILSAVKEKDVEYLDKTPSDDEDLTTHPFECPICCRFSDHILRTHCCNQYICHTCATRLRSGFFRSACPHCRKQPLVLVDPTPFEPVLCYRDAPTKVGRKIEWINAKTTAVAREGKGPAKRLIPRDEEQKQPLYPSTGYQVSRAGA